MTIEAFMKTVMMIIITAIIFYTSTCFATEYNKLQLAYIESVRQFIFHVSILIIGIFIAAILVKKK